MAASILGTSIGAVVGTTISDRPSFHGTVMSVRTWTMMTLAFWLLVMKRFCPFSTHSSPSSTALVMTPALSSAV